MGVDGEIRQIGPPGLTGTPSPGSGSRGLCGRAGASPTNSTTRRASETVTPARSRVELAVPPGVRLYIRSPTCKPTRVEPRDGWLTNVVIDMSRDVSQKKRPGDIE